jgi:hypothetical protein
MFNLCARRGWWVVKATPRPLHPRETDPVPMTDYIARRNMAFVMLTMQFSLCLFPLSYFHSSQTTIIVIIIIIIIIIIIHKEEVARCRDGNPASQLQAQLKTQDF